MVAAQGPSARNWSFYSNPLPNCVGKKTQQHHQRLLLMAGEWMKYPERAPRMNERNCNWHIHCEVGERKKERMRDRHTYLTSHHSHWGQGIPKTCNSIVTSIVTKGSASFLDPINQAYQVIHLSDSPHTSFSPPHQPEEDFSDRGMNECNAMKCKTGSTPVEQKQTGLFQHPSNGVSINRLTHEEEDVIITKQNTSRIWTDNKKKKKKNPPNRVGQEQGDRKNKSAHSHKTQNAL